MEGVDLEEARVDVRKDNRTLFSAQFYAFNSYIWVIDHGFPMNASDSCSGYRIWKLMRALACRSSPL